MGSLEVEKLVVGPLMTNCYIASSGNECAVIDAGAEGERIADHLRSRGIVVKYIFATHGHFDHVCGIDPVRDAFGAPFAINSNDLEMLHGAPQMAKRFADEDVGPIREPDDFVENGSYSINGIAIIPIHTPGHTEGSTSYLIEDLLFSGDTLFRGSIGRMDFGGSTEQMKKTIAHLKTMDDGITVYPGHGPSSTMGEEKRTNPFLTYYEL